MNRLEKYLYALVAGRHAGRIEGRGWMRFLQGKISDRIQLCPPQGKFYIKNRHRDIIES
jgi:hypothetical protein